MERIVWTDERLDERMAAIDDTSDRIFAEFAAVRQELRDFRSEFKTEMRELRGDFNRFQDRMVQIGFGLLGVTIASLTAVAVALIAAVA